MKSHSKYTSQEAELLLSFLNAVEVNKHAKDDYLNIMCHLLLETQ